LLRGEFAPVMTAVLDSVAERVKVLAPAFAFIDLRRPQQSRARNRCRASEDRLTG
jgi:hypothetical protein